MRRAILRESFLNRGGRATPPRGCRYAMLGAIRRTGCSFVFRFVFKPSPSLHPPRPPGATAKGGGRPRQAPDSDNYCRFAAGNPSSRRQQLFLLSLCSRADDSISLFSPTPPSWFSTRTSPAAVPFSRRLSSSGLLVVPPFLESERLDSAGLDRAVAVSREYTEGGGWRLRGGFLREV